MTIITDVLIFQFCPPAQPDRVSGGAHLSPGPRGDAAGRGSRQSGESSPDGRPPRLHQAGPEPGPPL